VSLGPEIITDLAGGHYTIGLLGIEGGVYSTNRTLFTITNGSIAARRIYLNRLNQAPPQYAVRTPRRA